MSPQEDPLRRVRDGGITKSRSSNKESAKVIDLTDDGIAAESVAEGYTKDGDEEEEDENQSVGVSEDEIPRDHGDDDEEEEEEEEEVDMEEDEDEDMAAHESKLTSKSKTHGYAHDDVYLLRVEHKAQVSDREDCVGILGVYAFLSDANDAAFSYTEVEDGDEPEIVRTWADDGSVHIKLGTEADEEIIEIDVERNNFTRRIPHNERPQPLA